MYRHFVPNNLHNQAESLVSQLMRLTRTPKACPYCQHGGFYKFDETRGYYRCQFCKKGFSRGIIV